MSGSLQVSRPTSATIDFAALRHNLGVVRRHAPRSRVLAVVKANAYGHGVQRVARALAAAGAEGFALLELDAAAALREAGITQRVVLLEGFFEAAELDELRRQRLDSVVHDEAQLAMLRHAATTTAATDYVPALLLKLNTGMNRLGFTAAQFPAAWAALGALDRAREATLMTHFANADDALGIDWQLQAFERITAGITAPRTLANSAAVVRYPQSHGEWVRPGIMLYGASPFAEVSAAALGLQPVMTLRSRIIAVQHARAGDRVGYGGTWTAARDTRIGVVACGYADGYPRHAPSGTPVRVGEHLSATVGRVSMDMLCVDITALPEAGVGSPVTLWGEGNPVDEVAACAGTVGYELLCALAPRVPVIEHG